MNCHDKNEGPTRFKADGFDCTWSWMDKKARLYKVIIECYNCVLREV